MRLFLILFTIMLAQPSLAKDKPAAKNIPNYDLEAAGLISSDLQGAFPKSIWKDQPRSEVQYLLQTMRTNTDNRALQEIIRRFLISQGDTRLIKNDIKIEHYADIFALRLKRLMDLGQYDDAFRLFSNYVPKADTSELAELGLILVLDRQGLPTACLDAKVLSPQFEENDFWINLGKICDIELGIIETASFENSSILQAIYNEKDFALNAAHLDLLLGLTRLEKHILFKKGLVSYDDEIKTVLNQSPPMITRFFLRDSSFPKKYTESLNTHAYNQNLLPSVVAELEVYDVTEMTQKSAMDFVILLLNQGDSVPSDLTNRLKILAANYPQNYVFIHFLSQMGLTETDYNVPEERFTEGLSHFTEKSAEKLIFIKTSLDKASKFSNNPASIYEKRLMLSEFGKYVIPDEANQEWWDEWQKEVQNQGFIGSSFLIALNTDNKNIEGQPSDVMLSIISSLSTVGLIDKARQLSKEILLKEITDMAGHKEGE
ncbi:MAG: hypothetical protein GW769_02750 [Alphaproteobacteria bacterium]|nr:hypothetical protein [Alphaproteobacteria bacterium]